MSERDDFPPVPADPSGREFLRYVTIRSMAAGYLLDEEALRLPPDLRMTHAQAWAKAEEVYTEARGVRAARPGFTPAASGAFPDVIPPRPPAPKPPDVHPDDRLPLWRNPRIGCEEIGGTWIHGRPHDCPKGARGLR